MLQGSGLDQPGFAGSLSVACDSVAVMAFNRFGSLDAATRLWWRMWGRRIDLTKETWLRGPMTGTTATDTSWLTREAEESFGRVDQRRPDAGLIPDFRLLGGPDFDPLAVHPQIVNFYQHTAGWQMQAWVHWTPGFRFAGGLIAKLFSRRLQQLALPTDTLDLAHGITSDISPVLSSAGAHLGSAWIRRLNRTNTTMYSGYYRLGQLPRSRQPHVWVTFPLQAGNVQVWLRPHNDPHGGLTLASPRGRFGDPGAYVTVRSSGGTWASRAPIHETFRLWVDERQTLRTDHTLKLLGVTAVRMHYRLDQHPDRANEVASV